MFCIGKRNVSDAFGRASKRCLKNLLRIPLVFLSEIIFTHVLGTFETRFGDVLGIFAHVLDTF